MLKRSTSSLCRFYKLEAADFFLCSLSEKLAAVALTNQFIDGFH